MQVLNESIHVTEKITVNSVTCDVEEEGDWRHGILLCEKRGWVSPSIPTSGWRGYFLSLKAVCIFDHKTDFLPISPHTYLQFLPPVTCLTLSLLSPSLYCLYPPFQALKLANCQLQQELAVSNSSALTSFQALFSNPAELTSIHLSTQLQSQHGMKIRPATF